MVDHALRTKLISNAMKGHTSIKLIVGILTSTLLFCIFSCRKSSEYYHAQMNRKRIWTCTYSYQSGTNGSSSGTSTYEDSTITITVLNSQVEVTQSGGQNLFPLVTDNNDMFVYEGSTNSGNGKLTYNKSNNSMSYYLFEHSGMGYIGTYDCVTKN